MIHLSVRIRIDNSLEISHLSVQIYTDNNTVANGAQVPWRLSQYLQPWTSGHKYQPRPSVPTASGLRHEHGGTRATAWPQP